MQEKKGWIWKQNNKNSNDGYWIKEEEIGVRHKHKLPFFCPYEKCRRITGTIDNEYLSKYGICKTCYTTLVEDRKAPLIDIEFYRERIKKRGY